MESIRKKYCEDYEVRADLHKYLIGRKGATARAIRETTGARIIFPEIGDPNGNIVQVTGTKEQIELGKKEIEKILSHYKNIVFDEMYVDQKHHHYFVRRGGEVCEAISKEFNNSIYICFPKGYEMKANSSMVTLKGSREAIEGTKKRIAAIVAGLTKLSTVEVIIPQKFHGHVIGSHGKIIQQLQTEYDVTIKFPKKKHVPPQFKGPVRPDGVRSSDVILITGKVQHCEDVKKILLLRVPRSEAEWEAVEPMVSGGVTRSMANFISEPEEEFTAYTQSTPVKRSRMEVNPEIEAAILRRMQEISEGKEPQLLLPPPPPPPPRPPPKRTQEPKWEVRSANMSMTNSSLYGDTGYTTGPPPLLNQSDWGRRNDVSKNSTYNNTEGRSNPWNYSTEAPNRFTQDGYSTTSASNSFRQDGYSTTNNVGGEDAWASLSGLPENIYSTNSVAIGDAWASLHGIQEDSAAATLHDYGHGYSSNVPNRTRNTNTEERVLRNPRADKNQLWDIPSNFGGGYSTGSSTRTDNIRAPQHTPTSTLLTPNGFVLKPWWSGNSILGTPPPNLNGENSSRSSNPWLQ